MLELIAIALLQVASLSTPSAAPVTSDVNIVVTPTDPTPTDTTPTDQGHGGWGGGII